MPNLFCLLKDISKVRGVGRVYMEDGTPLVASPFFPTMCLPKVVLRLFYRVEVLDCQISCLRDKLWYTISLDGSHDYCTLKVFIQK